jgi:hypothetical protein
MLHIYRDINIELRYTIWPIIKHMLHIYRDINIESNLYCSPWKLSKVKVKKNKC